MQIFYGITIALFYVRAFNTEGIENTLNMITIMVALGLLINSF